MTDDPEREIEIKIETDPTLTKAKSILVERGYETAHLRGEESQMPPVERVLNSGLRSHMNRLVRAMKDEDDARRHFEAAVKDTAREREDLVALMGALPPPSPKAEPDNPPPNWGSGGVRQ